MHCSLLEDSGCPLHVGRQPRAFQNLFQVRSITDQYLPNAMLGKRHHKTPAEMYLRDFYKACKGKRRKCTSPVPLTECLLSASCFCSTAINRGHTYHSKGMFHGWKVNSWFDLFQKYWRFDGGGRWGGGLRGLLIQEENDYRDRH